MAIPEVKDAQGSFVQRQGRAPVPGFYFIGRPWQRSRGSALLVGVGDDAAVLTAQISRDLEVPGWSAPGAEIGASAQPL